MQLRASDSPASGVTGSACCHPGVRGQWGSALPHPAKAQLHARLEQEPGMGRMWCQTRSVPCQALAPCLWSGLGHLGICSRGERGHRGLLVCVWLSWCQVFLQGSSLPSRSRSAGLGELKA